MIRIDPYNVVPKYYQLAEIIRLQILDGEWLPHAAIPSEREMETLYNVSRTTIRQAVQTLINEGALYREHGRGTFVARPKLQHSLHALTSFTHDMNLRGVKPGQQTLYLGYVEASNRIRRHLELPSEVSQVLQLERLRLGDGEPVGIHSSYLALPPSPTITLEDLPPSGSLYALLEAKFNLLPTEADQTLEATVADKREASLLGVTEGSPLLLIERTTWSQARKPFEFVKMLYRADRYKYFIRMTR